MKESEIENDCDDKMSDSNKDYNRSKSWRPLLLNTGGPRRIAKSYPESETPDSLNSNIYPHASTRSDKSLPSQKRSYSTISNNNQLSEPNVQSLLDNRMSDGSRVSLQTRKSLDRESKRLSSVSARSSYSEDNQMLMPPPVSDVNNTAENKLPKNLRDIVTINGKSYIKLKMIGSGGSSSVYRVLSSNNEVLALKCVNLQGATQSQYRDYVNEVKLLESLRNSPGIIYLVDYELNTSGNMLYILMECGETDLKSYLKEMTNQKQSLDINFIRLIWQQMLIAVNVIHHHNIIHSDLKPANFLFVKGNLKLIDFGIAQTIAAEATSVVRESQMGTINYISPESLKDISDSSSRKGIRIRRSTDVWSLGVILYQMVYQQLPWGDLPLNQKLLAILQDSYQIPFPAISNPWLLDIIKSCLQRDPSLRPSIDGENGLLSHPFLQPQGPRAMCLYKQMAVDNKIMKEVIRQIHDNATDGRWKEDEIIPLVTQELVIQCARNKPIDVLAALEAAEKKLTKM